MTELPARAVRRSPVSIVICREAGAGCCCWALAMRGKDAGQSASRWAAREWALGVTR